MELTESMQHFILHWGEMGAKWGVNRSVAQIHALLHLSPEPLPAEEIAATLNIARSNVSNSLKELLGWGIIKVSNKLGDRRDYFHAVRDIYDLIHIIVEERRSREYMPTLRAVKTAIEAAQTDGTPKQIRERLEETHRVMAEFDAWYVEVSRLPRSVHKTLLKLGGKIALIIGRSG